MTLHWLTHRAIFFRQSAVDAESSRAFRARAAARLLAVLLCTTLVTVALASVDRPGVDLEVFVREGCPHCADAKTFLTGLQERLPALRIAIYDVGDDPDALARLIELAKQQNVHSIGVPAFYVADHLLIGYSGPSTTGSRILRLLDTVKGHEPAPVPPEACRPTVDCDAPTPDVLKEGETVDLPLVGPVSVRRIGLLNFTVLMGLLDGFNPCAMWMLLFLLSLLVHLRDRVRMAVVAGTFVLVSGLVYFAFMAAWLNVFLAVGISRSIQVLLAAVAILIGSLNIKDFFALGSGPAVGIPASSKPGIYARTRALLEGRHLPATLFGVAALAVMVNAVELLCTAGLPALYTHILTLHDLSYGEYYGYLALYNAAYVLDDALVAGVAVVTLSQRRLQESGGRWLKLVSGVVMTGLGILLLTKPDLLS